MNRRAVRLFITWRSDTPPYSIWGCHSVSYSKYLLWLKINKLVEKGGDALSWTEFQRLWRSSVKINAGQRMGLHQFFRQVCEVGHSFTQPKGEAYKRYLEWVDERYGDNRPVSRRQFNTYFGYQDYINDGTSNLHTWGGFRLLAKGEYRNSNAVSHIIDVP